MSRFPAALGAGFVLGALVTLAGLARFPGVALPDVAPVTSASERGEIVESFFVEAPADGIAITHSGKLPLGVFPPSAPRFTEPAIARGLALLVKVRNARGEIVGFASELEAHPEGDIVTEDVTWKTDWTVVLPGRGALFLHQLEHSGELGPKVLRPVLETKQAWTGDWTVQTTAGPRDDRRGLLVGGTGEFSGARGSFVEIDRVTKLSPEGVLEGRFELRVFREGAS